LGRNRVDFFQLVTKYDQQKNYVATISTDPKIGSVGNLKFQLIEKSGQLKGCHFSALAKIPFFVIIFCIENATL